MERPNIKIIMDKAKSYIGAHTNYPAPDGAPHTVGNDLADGPWNPETIERVLRDVKDVLEGRRS